MSLRPLVAAAVLLVATLAAESRAAFAAPGAFLISSPANGAFVTATPTLTWQASSNAASYTVTITPTTGAPFVKAGLTVSTFTIPAASALTEAAGPYTWRVTARDAAGATTDSNSWSFFVDTTPPLAVRVRWRPPTAPSAAAPAASAGMRRPTPAAGCRSTTSTSTASRARDTQVCGLSFAVAGA